MVNECEVIKISFLLLGLLGENVAVISVFSLDFSRSGKRETLFGTGVGFKLCHFTKVLIIYFTTLQGLTPLQNHLFLLYRSNHHYHSLTLKLRHMLGTSILLKFHSETQKKFLSLVSELNGTTSEEY